MKTPKLLSFIFVIGIILSFSSCKQKVSDDSFTITTQPLTMQEIEDIAAQLSAQNRTLQTQNEDSIRRILLPLIETGRSYYNEILSQIDLNDPSLNLTQEEREAIQNMTEDQLGLLGFVYSVSHICNEISNNNDENRTSYRAIDKNTILNCLSAALGISDIIAIVENTAALATVDGAIAVLKLIGKRYLGYLGLAVAVVSFVECVS
ncbi:MAG: hypothetical protein GXO27_06060 [Chlorobi bacterium]|nr:hypothetical protein [Chlorobiota bacterium]